MSQFKYKQLHASEAAIDFYSGLAKPVHAAFKKGFNANAATSWAPLGGLAQTMASEMTQKFIFTNAKVCVQD